MKRKYYISPLEKGYSSSDKSGRKLVMVLAILFTLISYPAYSFFGGGGISLGPLLVVAKDILEVSRQIDEGLNTLERLENATIGRLEQIRNDLYRYTHLKDEINDRISYTLYRIERIYQRATTVFSRDFWRDYGSGGGLNRIIGYLDEIQIDEHGNVVKPDGSRASDNTVKAYIDTLSGGSEPRFSDAKIKAVIDTNRKAAAGYKQVKVKRNTVKNAVAKSIATQSTVARLKEENEEIHRRIVHGVDSGVLQQKMALLMAIQNEHLALLNEQIAEQNKLLAMLVGKQVKKEEEAVYKMLKAKALLE